LGKTDPASFFAVLPADVINFIAEMIVNEQVTKEINQLLL